MSIQSCYQVRHSSALNKISGRLPEGREFIASFDVLLSVPQNAKIACIDRWYGNASERKCNELTRHFKQRYVITSENFESLQLYNQKTSRDDFPWINHFYMLLDDPYYRWATTDFMPDRFQSGLIEIPRSRFDQELKKQLPETVGAGSLARYGQNLLTAIRDNGLLEGKGKKIIVSPALNVKTMAFMLYTLSDLGVGSNDFDMSPLFRSILKPRDLLVPLFSEGEQLGYWDFTGDRERIKLNLNHPNLKSWLEACI
ncbi:hypothetical protein [Desulfosediminicola sp.]|uniref:hypothetical protein n=1 Tax=Desulfosediminicola sp. TaxID=2886825 RepID=UPI003AF2835C